MSAEIHSLFGDDPAPASERPPFPERVVVEGMSSENCQSVTVFGQQADGQCFVTSSKPIGEILTELELAKRIVLNLIAQRRGV